VTVVLNRADRAVEAARRAFPAWRAVAPSDRGRAFLVDGGLTAAYVTPE
jgi:acyl-CoA reductase-like NAD-dependent aldehyde dehydrogenase